LAISWDSARTATELTCCRSHRSPKMNGRSTAHASSHRCAAAGDGASCTCMTCRLRPTCEGTEHQRKLCASAVVTAGGWQSRFGAEGRFLYEGVDSVCIGQVERFGVWWC